MAAHGSVLAFEKSRDMHARLLALVERRTRQGISAKADVSLALGRLSSIEADLASAQSQRDSAIAKLQLLTGRRVHTGSLERAVSHPPPKTPADLQALLTAARAKSPQIVKAHAQLELAAAETDIAEAKFSPEVHLRAEQQYGALDSSGRASDSRIYLSLSTAFGSGLSSFSGVEAARARVRSAREEIQTQQLALNEQIQNDTTLARAVGRRLISLERARDSAARITASWERQFLAGRKQWLDLMNAAREEAQTEVQLANTVATEKLVSWRLAILTRGVDAVFPRSN